MDRISGHAGLRQTEVATLGPPILSHIRDSTTTAPRVAGADQLQYYFEDRCLTSPAALAVICGNECLTYAELDRRANQLAHEIIAHRVEPGDTIGILLDRSVHTYIALLAVLKSGAAFVPIDPSFPRDRVEFIAGDASLSLLLTDGKRAEEFQTSNIDCLPIDAVSIDTRPIHRPDIEAALDALCYIIYTSGTTGRPKGVAINHSSICNFLRVCSPIYGYTAQDRVYQGMTIAFDFSIEEIWPTLMAGATIIAGPTDHRRVGASLVDFLIEQRVTVMCCVPTLLATMDRDVPSLRLLLVGGEACPADLARRWCRVDRRMLNTYGPTETTVTATWTELLPDKSVTIGVPLPTYSVHILDEQQHSVATGEIGEICIGGPGVARGYVNRPDLTAEKFVLFGNTRLYRSGDLGRILADGEIEYLGRIDGQIKIRGYRIELAEIEAVLLDNPELTNAVVAKVSLEDGLDDLVAYVTLRAPASNQTALRQHLHDSLRKSLPAYMVPAFIEFLPTLPTLASGKTDRAKLLPPASQRLGSNSSADIAPASPLEHELAATWAAVMCRDTVSVEADFFLDLGGHSLFAAGVISRMRKNPALRHLSVAELYAHPTVRSLARHIELTRTDALPAEPRVEETRLHHSNRRVFTAGLVQMAMLYGVFLLFAIPTGPPVFLQP